VQGAFRRWLRNLQRAAHRHGVVQALVSVLPRRATGEPWCTEGSIGASWLCGDDLVARHACSWAVPRSRGVSEELQPATSLAIPALTKERGAAQWRVRAASHIGPAPPQERGAPELLRLRSGGPAREQAPPWAFSGAVALQWASGGQVCQDEIVTRRGAFQHGNRHMACTRSCLIRSTCSTCPGGNRGRSSGPRSGCTCPRRRGRNSLGL
jgi:hypothetical protein